MTLHEFVTALLFAQNPHPANAVQVAVREADRFVSQYQDVAGGRALAPTQEKEGFDMFPMYVRQVPWPEGMSYEAHQEAIMRAEVKAFPTDPHIQWIRDRLAVLDAASAAPVALDEAIFPLPGAPEVDEMVIPPKRGPGRPRKNGL